MNSRLMSTALFATFLMGCATPSIAPQPVLISPSLTYPCPRHLPPVLRVWGDLAIDYVLTLSELADCSARQKALADAVTLKQGDK